MGKFIIGRDNVEYLKKLERKKYISSEWLEHIDSITPTLNGVMSNESPLRGPGRITFNTDPFSILNDHPFNNISINKIYSALTFEEELNCYFTISESTPIDIRMFRFHIGNINAVVQTPNGDNTVYSLRLQNMEVVSDEIKFTFTVDFSFLADT